MSHEAESHHLSVHAPSKRQERRSQEVWRHNLDEEMARMADVAEHFQHISLDTQFPGTMVRPSGPFDDIVDYHYQTLKWNVELTRLLQIGFTFSDARGNRPKGISTWRFNFRFDAGRNGDVYAPETLEMLRSMRGLDLARHSAQGIELHHFGERFWVSGLVTHEEIRWITYLGTSFFRERHPDPGLGRSLEPPWVSFFGMYDFAQLVLILTGEEHLPDEVRGFYEVLDALFPSRCDVAKHVHRLALTSVERSSPQERGSQQRPVVGRNAHQILEAYFRLPDAVRRTAFDEEEEEEHAAQHTPQRIHRKGAERGRQQAGRHGANAGR